MLESHYPNITKPYVRGISDQCNYRRYSTEGWPGGTPLLELDGNHIEGAARSKVSRSSSPAAVEESLGLSRTNHGNIQLKTSPVVGFALSFALLYR